MEQQKMKSYIFYAIGEIFLVVIGILIALQVNNWNEERKITKRTSTYLRSLVDEIETNEEKLSYNLNYLDKNIEGTIYTMRLLKPTDEDSLSDEAIIKALNSYINPLYLSILERLVYNDLVSAGILEHIEDQQFKKEILNLGEALDYYDFYLERASKTWIDYLMPYQIENFLVINNMDSIRGISMPETEISINRSAYVNNQYFDNQLRSKLIFYRNLAGHIDRMNKEMSSLKQGIISRIN